jgi:hypothetical protein
MRKEQDTFPRNGPYRFEHALQRGHVAVDILLLGRHPIASRLAGTQKRKFEREWPSKTGGLGTRVQVPFWSRFLFPRAPSVCWFAWEPSDLLWPLVVALTHPSVVERMAFAAAIQNYTKIKKLVRRSFEPFFLFGAHTHRRAVIAATGRGRFWCGFLVQRQTWWEALCAQGRVRLDGGTRGGGSIARLFMQVSCLQEIDLSKLDQKGRADALREAAMLQKLADKR